MKAKFNIGDVVTYRGTACTVKKSMRSAADGWRYEVSGIWVPERLLEVAAPGQKPAVRVRVSNPFRNLFKR